MRLSIWSLRDPSTVTNLPACVVELSIDDNVAYAIRQGPRLWLLVAILHVGHGL